MIVRFYGLRFGWILVVFRFWESLVRVETCVYGSAGIARLLVSKLVGVSVFIIERIIVFWMTAGEVGVICGVREEVGVTFGVREEVRVSAE